MRIAINLRLLNPGKIGGMEIYVRNLIKHLLRIDLVNEYLLLVTAQNDHTLVYDGARVHKAFLPHRNYEAQIPGLLRTWNADLYFCPLLVLEPLGIELPSVVNIPDLQHEFFPDFFSAAALEWRRTNYKASAQAAAAVLTLSEFSRDTIVEKIGVSADKVFAIHLAAGEEYQANLEQAMKEQVRNKYGLPANYGYFPANTWPHKNHAKLLDALSAYRRKYGDCPTIVLTGAQSEGHKNFAAKAKQLALTDRVRYLGYVEKQELPYLYDNAAFLVFPSLFEGFGMPVLEAMHCGCPVACSNTTSLPEVARNAALYFDPQDSDDIAEKLHAIATDEALRARLAAEGRRQALTFSWDATAARTLSVFDGVAGTTPARLSAKQASCDRPLVTIITPSFNQGRFIEETILSVLGQDYPNIEYIVVDGGSSDNTLAVLEKYAGRLRWLSERDNGQADAINKGFRMARGEIVAWLNSDDTYIPGAVGKVVDIFLSDPSLAMVYGEGYEIDENGNSLHRFPQTQPFNLSKLIHVWDYILQPTVFMKKTALDQTGLLDESLNWCLDWDLWIRIAKKHRVAHTMHFLANSRIHGETKTSTGAFKRYVEILAVIRKYSQKKLPPGYFFYGYDFIANALRDRFPRLYDVLLRRLAHPVIALAVKIYNKFLRASEYS